MKTKRNLIIGIPCAALGLVAASGAAFAQDQTPHPWRAADDPAPQYQAQQPQNQQPQYQQPQYQQPQYQQDQYPQGAAAPNGNYNQNQAPQQQYPQQQQQYPQQQQPYPQQPLPAHLRIDPGTFVTVRVNQWLSSDRNKSGEAFAATLEQPIIVNGVVVAQRGQTVGARITEAQKAGRVEGTSRLGVELTDLTLADGHVVPVQSQMLSRDGRTTNGRDIGAVAGTTAIGAAIGAAAGWGRGAAIGAGAGAAAGLAGVLLTRGEPTVIHPESVLTFRISAPVEVATDRAPDAFHYADDRDYGRAPQMSMQQRPSYYDGAYAGGAPPPVVGVAPYPYPYYAPYYGYGYGYGYPGISIGIGRGYYGRGYYRGGYYRGRR